MFIDREEENVVCRRSGFNKTQRLTDSVPPCCHVSPDIPAESKVG